MSEALTKSFTLSLLSGFLCPTPSVPLKQNTRWDWGRHSPDLVDLRTEVKYIHGAFQGVSDLVRCLFPRETEDAEEGASL